jgi:hypothetical protein
MPFMSSFMAAFSPGEQLIVGEDTWST